MIKEGGLKCSKNRHLVCDLIIVLILRAEPSKISQICFKQLVGSPLKSAFNKCLAWVATSAKRLLGSSTLYPDSLVASPASREKFNFSKQANLCQKYSID